MACVGVFTLAVIPVSACHLTHRCHDRKFLFRFKTHRKAYRERLRRELLNSGVSLLSYCVTGNHVHLLVSAEDPADIARLMQRLQGDFAKWYNRSKKRSGAFWNGRYHCTMVESGTHLWNCMRYINLNMVRAGVVEHPRDWLWCGYDEISGARSKCLVLDRERLLAATGAASARDLGLDHDAMIEEALGARRLEREPQWTDAIAVGSQQFVDGVVQAHANKWRARLQIRAADDGAWLVSEDGATYGAVSAAAEPVQTGSEP